MLRRQDEGCETCIKIYKKSMAAILVNVVIMVALIIESQRNISLIHEEEFILMSENITEMACANFCDSYEIEVGGACCNPRQRCIEKQTCRLRKLEGFQQQISDSSHVIIGCYIMLAISIVFFAVYCCLKAKQRKRREPARQQQQLLEDLMEAPPELNWGEQWSEYVQTNNVEEICVVCHDKMAMTRVAELRCQHIFHVQCIREWFQSRDTVNTCPICRQIN